MEPTLLDGVEVDVLAYQLDAIDRMSRRTSREMPTYSGHRWLPICVSRHPDAGLGSMSPAKHDINFPDDHPLNRFPKCQKLWNSTETDSRS